VDVRPAPAGDDLACGTVIVILSQAKNPDHPWVRRPDPSLRSMALSLVGTKRSSLTKVIVTTTLESGGPHDVQGRTTV
jgi:hypothetical protein